MLYIAIGILGATVMPHNLYLHSSIVQTRKIDARTTTARREAMRYATVDSTFALMFALFINAAILIVAGGRVPLAAARDEVAEIQDAHRLLTPVLGVGVASTLFAVALLASGQNSTLTGTLAGQIVMEGFLNFRMRPWLRRLITRAIAIVPAVIVIGYLRRERDDRPARGQPGGAQHAARVRRVAADALHADRAPRWAASSTRRWIKVLGLHDGVHHHRR